MASDSVAVKEKIGELLKTNNEDTTDCEFEFEDKVKVRCHKNILSIASPVFKAMLYGDLRNTSGAQKLQEMEAAIFEKMLEFIYTDNVELKSIEMACKVYMAGEKFLLPRLKDLCEEYIIANINVSDLFYLLDFVKIFENKNIYDECVNFVRSETQTILDDDKFTYLDLDKLLFVVDQPALNVDSEFQLFLAIERWAKRKADEKGVPVKEIVATMPVLKNVRFLSMKGDFAKGPGKSELLSSDEKLSLAMNILSFGTCAVPENFSSLRKPRPQRVKYQYNFANVSGGFRSTMYSPEFPVKPTLWRLSLSGEINEYYGWAVLHIEYRGIPGNVNSSCSATVQLKFVPSEKGCQPIKKSFKHTFQDNESSHRNPVEIKWSNMFDKNCQFVKDNCITVEAIVEPDPDSEPQDSSSS